MLGGIYENNLDMFQTCIGWSRTVFNGPKRCSKCTRTPLDFRQFSISVDEFQVESWKKRLGYHNYAVSIVIRP